MRGPLVYCLEWPDNSGHALNAVIADDAPLASQFRPDLLNGVQVVTADALAVDRTGSSGGIRTNRRNLVAIPYYAWANRGMGEMTVWIARDTERARRQPVPPAPIEEVRTSGGVPKAWTGSNDQNDLSAVYDGADPLSSADESNLYFRMRPPAGQPAWIEYRFKAPATVASSQVYWVDDSRFCRLPASWRLLYRSGAGWKAVTPRAPYTVSRDAFNRVAFDPIETTAVRLEIEPQTVRYDAGQIGPPDAMFLDKGVEWREAGVIEWRIAASRPGSWRPR